LEILGGVDLARFLDYRIDLGTHLGLFPQAPPKVFRPKINPAPWEVNFSPCPPDPLFQPPTLPFFYPFLGGIIKKIICEWIFEKKSTK